MRYLTVKMKSLIEELKFARMYPDRDFRKIDRTLWWNYVGTNPYRTCRKYFQERGVANIHQYGETPLTTMDAIAKFAGINQDDHVYELVVVVGGHVSS